MDRRDTLFVGSLDLSVDEAMLYHAFSTFGEVAKVTLIKDKITGDSRGFAYIMFRDPRGAAEALHFDGLIFNSRRLKVEFAVSEPGGGRFVPRGDFIPPPMRGRGGPPPFARGRGGLHHFAMDVDLPPFARGSPPMRMPMRGVPPGPLMPRGGGRGFLARVSPPRRGRYPLPAPPPRESYTLKADLGNASAKPLADEEKPKVDTPATTTAASGTVSSTVVTSTAKPAMEAVKTAAEKSSAATSATNDKKPESTTTAKETDGRRLSGSSQLSKDQPPAKKPTMGDGLLPTPRAGKPAPLSAKENNPMPKPLITVGGGSRSADAANSSRFQDRSSEAPNARNSRFADRRADGRPPPRTGRDDHRSPPFGKSPARDNAQHRNAHTSRERAADLKSGGVPPNRPLDTGRNPETPGRYNNRQGEFSEPRRGPFSAERSSDYARRERQDNRPSPRSLDSRSAAPYRGREQPPYRGRDDTPRGRREDLPPPEPAWAGPDRRGPLTYGKDSPYQGSARDEPSPHSRERESTRSREPDNRSARPVMQDPYYKGRDAGIHRDGYQDRQESNRDNRQYSQQGGRDDRGDSSGAPPGRYDSQAAREKSGLRPPASYDERPPRDERSYPGNTDRSVPYEKEKYNPEDMHHGQGNRPPPASSGYEEPTFSRQDKVQRYDAYKEQGNPSPRDSRALEPRNSRALEQQPESYCGGGYPKGGRADVPPYRDEAGYSRGGESKYNAPADDRQYYEDRRDRRDDQYAGRQQYPPQEPPTGAGRGDYDRREHASQYSDQKYATPAAQLPYKGDTPRGAAPRGEVRRQEYQDDYSYRKQDYPPDGKGYKEERHSAYPGTSETQISGPYPGPDANKAPHDRSYAPFPEDPYQPSYAAPEKGYPNKDAYTDGGPAPSHASYRPEQVPDSYNTLSGPYTTPGSDRSYADTTGSNMAQEGRGVKPMDRSYQSQPVLAARPYEPESIAKNFDKVPPMGSHTGASRSYGDGADRGYVGYGSAGSRDYGKPASSAGGDSYKPSPTLNKDVPAGADRSYLPSNSAFDQLYSIAAGALAAKDFAMSADGIGSSKANFFSKTSDGDKSAAKG